MEIVGYLRGSGDLLTDHDPVVVYYVVLKSYFMPLEVCVFDSLSMD